MIRTLNASDPDFDELLADLLSMPDAGPGHISQIVADIIADVRDRGDAALLELSNKFDRLGAEQTGDLEVSAAKMRQAAERVDPLVIDALQTSVARVRKYHLEQMKSLGGLADWSFEDETGNKLGQLVRPIERVGVYVPGGKASYPSSVVMTVVPAKVAGVGEVILMVPASDGRLSDSVQAAALFCGVDRMFKIGGAQAVAAMAYGTALVPRVDKIVGPGNIYVATAKAQVFGQVGIDMIAGPSEIVIVADGSANPEWLVMDMFAQAEHDELAQSILISTDQSLLTDVARLIDEMKPGMARAGIINESIANRGALIRVPSLPDAAAVVNRIAPEHLQLVISGAEEFIDYIRHAGAIFVGSHSAEVVGDYTAGPSHVLPTGGTARFASPLGVYDFQVRSLLIQCSARGAIDLSRTAAILAREEGLEAHARSAEFRVQG